jgi:hypothetical protein
MIKLIAVLLQPILNFRPIRRIRRNHGLEHATIHVMSRRAKDLRILGGRAVVDGFFIYGAAETDQVHVAVEEAISRMRGGEHSLAVHPNCGTGLVTTAIMTSFATLLGTLGTQGSWQNRVSRLPTLIVLSVIAIIFSQPTGLSLQRYITTLGDPGDLEVVQISRQEIKSPFAKNALVVHRIWTRAG